MGHDDEMTNVSFSVYGRLGWQVSRSFSTSIEFSNYQFHRPAIPSKNNVLSLLRPMDENPRRHEQDFSLRCRVRIKKMINITVRKFWLLIKKNWLTFSTYLEYITLSKGSRAKSKSPCAFRRKRWRKSSSSRGTPEGKNGKRKDPWTFRKCYDFPTK